MLGYLLSYVLRFGVGGLPPVLALTLTEEHRRHIEPVFGCSFDEFVANVAAQMRFLRRRIVQAARLWAISY